MARTIDIQFPTLGVVRRMVHDPRGAPQAHPTPWAINCRLEDSLTGRLRGGSFEGPIPVARPTSIVYRDRTLTFSDNAITASRVGDGTDTTLSADVSDMLRPALFQCSEADEQGAKIVALVPHKDAHLLCFTATETWVQQGDPHSGPRRRVSDEVGIVGPDAWCVAHDSVYFLSSRGLYQVGADGTGLKPLSEEVLPEDLIDVDDDEVKLDYDHASRSVSIHQRASPSWFYDTARGGFWPFDTTTSQSHVLIGPLRLGGLDMRGLIQTLHGVMAEGSASVRWRIITADTAQAAADSGKAAIQAALDLAATGAVGAVGAVGATGDYSRYVRAEGGWRPGRSRTARPRVSGMFACLWLSSDGAWAFEAITMSVIPAGAWR